jgi:hypothetical protein
LNTYTDKHKHTRGPKAGRTLLGKRKGNQIVFFKFSGLHPIPLLRGGGKTENPEKNHRQHALNFTVEIAAQSLFVVA